MGGTFGWQELLVILAIVLVIFGASRLAGLGKASGRAIREFKDELKGPDAVAAGPVDATAAPSAPIVPPPADSVDAPASPDQR